MAFDGVLAPGQANRAPSVYGGEFAWALKYEIKTENWERTCSQFTERKDLPNYTRD